MFLRELGSSDGRFKRLSFHEGMNILLADKTEGSKLGDSRNGAGKTSFVRIFRYLLGGNLDNSLKSDQLSTFTFWANIDTNAGTEATHVERPVNPRSKVIANGEMTNIDKWKADIASLFRLPEETTRPTVGQLVGQLIRDYFNDPLKTYANESSWESGARIGYFLGFTPEILAKAGKISALEKNRKALKKAISDGTLGSGSFDEKLIRDELAQKRRRHSRIESDLAQFRVDEQYTNHQSEADKLTHAIRDLNDEGLALEQRKRDLELAMKEESSAASGAATASQLQAMYAEVGVVLPGIVARRFDEVSDFHASVVRNRKLYLESELSSVTARLSAIQTERSDLGSHRASVMKLLESSMALETFHDAERDLTVLEFEVADLERRLDLAQSIGDKGLQLRSLKAEAEVGVRTEMAEREGPLEEAISLFQELGQEIYDDREVSLLIEATNRGTLSVIPKIDGDASAGILGVKTFLLDIVCLVMAIKSGRTPRILVHDSLLFDSMDDRQVASCLNIGARLADTIGFQYVVTLNSDRLIAAEAEGFERQEYVIDPVLTDSGEDSGLFGFRFQ